MTKTLRAAKIYLDLGFSIIPVKKDKKPFFSWEKYQKERTTMQEVKEWHDKWTDMNIGIVTGMISNLAVIDIDSEKGFQAIQEYIPDSIVFPVARTPKSGWHYYFRCPDEKLRNNARLITDCDLRANGGYVVAPPSVNGTGNAWSWEVSITKTDIPMLPAAYILYIYNAFSLYSVLSKSEKKPDLSAQQMFTTGRRDNDIFHVANCLLKGGANENVCSQVLNILAKNCNPPFSESEVEIKIKSALKRQKEQNYSITQEIKDYVMTTKGNFLTTDINNFLGLTTRDNKKKVSVVLGRLADEGIIERTGNKNGQFCKNENNFERIKEFKKENLTPIDIKFPLDIHHYVKILQSNIVVIAGEKHSGKTAMCLSLATMNKDKKNIRYISTEFGDAELYERLSKMNDIDPDKWIKEVEFGRQYADNLHKSIKPNDINIVDFVEVEEGKFYMIVEQIKKIYQQLRQGIAVLAIQKKRGRDRGIGGDLSAEKARLYINLQKEKINGVLKKYRRK